MNQDKTSMSSGKKSIMSNRINNSYINYHNNNINMRVSLTLSDKDSNKKSN